MIRANPFGIAKAYVMQGARSRNPSALRVIIALLVAPAIPAMPGLVLPVMSIIIATTSYTAFLLFFAPLYFIVRRHVAIYFGACLVIGAAATVLCSLLFLARFEAIDIYLRFPVLGVSPIFSSFTSSLFFIGLPVIIASVLFCLIVKTGNQDAGSPANPPQNLLGDLRAISRSPALGMFLVLALCLVVGVYLWNIHKYLSEEAADEGIINLYAYSWTPFHESAPPTNPIVLKAPREFRYQSRSGRSEPWKNHKYSETSFMLFYPDFTPPRAPENIARGCQYYCNNCQQCENELTILVKNVENYLKWSKATSYAEATADSKSKFPGGWEPAAGVAGFDKVSQRTNQGKVESKLLLMSPNGTDEVALAAECSMQSPKQLCYLYFSLKCNSNIGIELRHWPYERLNEAVEVQHRVDTFVSAMVETPACKK